MKKEFQIYTDGACIGNGKKENIGGWSFVVVKDGNLSYEQCEIEFNTTNNRQEMFAVLNALKYCQENKIKDFVIFCDSQYVVNGFTDWMFGWVKKGFKRGHPLMPIPNHEIWRELYVIHEQMKPVDLRWVRGHNGNEWNEYADQLIEAKMSIAIDYGKDS